MRISAAVVGLVVIGTIGFLLAPSIRIKSANGATNPPNTGIGVIRLGGGNWGSLSNVDKYSAFLVSSGNANAAGSQTGRALMYACGTNMPSDSTSSECGVSYSEALANNWILKDSSGNPVHYKGSSPVLTDIGSSAYQQRFVAAIDADLRTHPGVDGVFIDDVTGSLIGSGTPVSPLYPDDANYRAAMLSFLRAVGPALKAKGWYVAVNASILDGAIESTTGTAWDGSQYIWWVNQIAPYVDGITMEHWQQNWDGSDSVRVSGSTGTQAWDGWERIPAAVQRRHRDFFALDRGRLDDANKAAYLRASFLLNWRRGSSFLYTDDYDGSGDPWERVAEPDIGLPTGPARRVGTGFRRTFTRGVVVVNPSPTSAQTFNFRVRYETGGRTGARTITLAPATGLVLRRFGRSR
jgi:hypothetical protein